MKTIFTLIILAFSVCSFGQNVSNSGDVMPQVQGGASMHVAGTTDAVSNDSIGIAHAGFSEASQKIFNDLQTEITELQKQLQEKVKRQDDMFSLLCGAAVPPVDPKRVIKDGVQVKPGELILKYRK